MLHLISPPVFAAIIGAILTGCWLTMLTLFYWAWRAQDLRHWFREAGFLLYCTAFAAACVCGRFLLP